MVAAVLIAFALLLTACDRENPRPPPSASSPEAAVAQPVVDEVEAVATDAGPGPADGDAPAGDAAELTAAAGRGVLTAPDAYDHLIPRLSSHQRPLFANLVYEGNNMVLRGRRLPTGLYEDSGETIAGRWREAARQVEGLFVLRDALYSQQDHPLDHEAYAPMLPPSWVTVAVAEVLAGRSPDPVQAPPLDDDDRWASLTTPGEMFGSFPQSETLFGWASRRRSGADATARRRIGHARAMVRALAEQARVMIAAAPAGPEAVAAAGAEAITASDRRYFGAELRRRRVIPISVENPNQHEVDDEGKGFSVAGRELPPRAIELATRAVLSRRLADGDLALERYDLTRPDDRRRAIELLEVLIPEGADPSPRDGHQLWLWVNGRLGPRGVEGEDAAAHIAGFRRQVEAAAVDTSRLRYLSKPHVALPRGAGRAAALASAAERFRALGLPLSVNLTSGPLRRLWASPEP